MDQLQKDNLMKLRDYLYSLPEDYDRFDMSVYFYDSLSPHAFFTPSEARPSCGTSACALGHGPAAGIEALEGEGWLSYSERQFGISREDYFELWEWVFCEDWSKYHLERCNISEEERERMGIGYTAHDAATRIQCLVDSDFEVTDWMTDAMVKYEIGITYILNVRDSV